MDNNKKTVNACGEQLSSSNTRLNKSNIKIFAIYL